MDITYAVGQFVLFIVVLVLITPVLGRYLADVFDGRDNVARRILGGAERAVYRITRVDPEVEMRWTQYAGGVVVLGCTGIALLYAMLRLQAFLPANPGHVAGMRPDLALNTAVSFVTNTNWQAYAPEHAVSMLVQVAGLCVQQFISAATGLAVGVAVIRGFARASATKVGNFWVDLTRAWLYVLLPLSIVFAVVLAGLGVAQTFGSQTVVHTIEGVRQTIATGPFASFEAIKELGTNGGGLVGANSAYPLTNPSPLTNFLEALAILAIPAALTATFGRMVGNRRQGWALFAAMLVLFCVSLGVVYGAERAGNPLLSKAGADTVASAQQTGGNTEGKEVRYGLAGSALFGTATTAASAGAVDSAHDSYTPLGGGAMLLNILLGELVFGGVGVGLASMLVYALLAVFIAGLMVGRTPEYLGKKIESREVRLAMLTVLVLAFSILGGTALSVVTRSALAARGNLGPHGFTEILYALSSATGNNGSAMAGLAAGSPFYNVITALAMFAGRYLFIIPVLAIAGSLAGKKRAEASSGTFPTDGVLFVGLLVGTVLIVGALTFFPALALGPIVEHFLMLAGRLF